MKVANPIYLHQIWEGGGGGEVLLGIFVGGVRLGSPKADLISD